MKYTTWIMCGILIIFGLFASVFAFTGFDMLMLVCAGNTYVYRALLSLTGIAALWLIFWLFAFRPTRFLS